MFKKKVSDQIINEALFLPSPKPGALPIAVGGHHLCPETLLRAPFVGIYWVAQGRGESFALLLFLGLSKGNEGSVRVNRSLGQKEMLQSLEKVNDAELSFSQAYL